MKVFSFSKDTGQKITHFESNFVLSRLTRLNGRAQVTCMYLEENGVIGYHKGATQQLLLILAGEGLVRSNKGEFREIKEGQAVLWDTNEWHETKTINGLTALAIESEVIDISQLKLL